MSATAALPASVDREGQSALPAPPREVQAETAIAELAETLSLVRHHQHDRFISANGLEEAERLAAVLGGQDFQSKIARAVAYVEARARPATGDEVGRQIALLLGSYPNARPSDPAVYSRMLIEDVRAAQPTWAALDSACRHWRQKQKWPPSVAELLDELGRAEGRWRVRADMMRSATETIRRHRELIDRTKARDALIEAERADLSEPE